MSGLWLWILILGLVAGLALTCWGVWWLWRKVMAIWHELERVMGRLDEIGELLEQVDLSPLDEAASGPGGRGEAW
jgi:hypothetical protein